MELYKIGSKGQMVKQIQAALAGAGLKLIPDGKFGTLTQAAVIEFQIMNGLKADGIVGPATLAKLIPIRFKKSKRTITEIIVHCTATPEGRNDSLEKIRKMHIENGWSDIGYHYLVTLDGRIWEGRDIDTIGAHCRGHNLHSIGISYVGGMNRDMTEPKDTRTEAQKAAMLCLLIDLTKMYPDAKIIGHHDINPGKACPCFNATLEYHRL